MKVAQSKYLMRKMLHLFYKENRVFVFVTNYFFSKGNTIADFADYCGEVVFESKNYTIASGQGLTLSKIQGHRTFVVCNEGEGGYLFGRVMCRAIAKRDCWHITRNGYFYNNHKQDTHVTIFGISNENKVDHNADLFSWSTADSCEQDRPDSVQYPGYGIDLTVYGQQSRRLPQKVMLQDVWHRGYNRIIYSRSYLSWCKRYNNCDIAYPGAAEVSQSSSSPFTYVARDGNRRLIKMKRLGLQHTRLYVFADSEEYKAISWKRKK